MGLIIFLFVTEILAIIVLRQHFLKTSRGKYYISITVHLILSIWLWFMVLTEIFTRDFFDSPHHIWLLLNIAGMITAVAVPRAILILLHFTGILIKLKNGGHIKGLTDTGLILSVIFALIIAEGTFAGRYNFKTEQVNLEINGLSKELDGLKIIHLSDMHLASFYNHSYLLQEVVDKVNAIKPDLILNTGDFISYGWREFGRNDTILAKAKSRYGNFAVMGNHDFGTYHPYFNEADRKNNVLIMNQLIRASGYTLLNDEFKIVNVNGAKIALIGITTMGRHPDISYGDIGKAIAGTDSADLKILLSHDPNHWKKAITGTTDIDITLSGHTHGMQMGIYTKNFKWSPSRYFYPHWSGVYSEGIQLQYVNLGLGVLAVPFRIWMPPEITVITLKSN